MAIASVVQGLIETEDGKVFELDSCKGSAWLESIGSFRYEPTGANKPYTVRQETKKGGDYWYGYRKVAGKLHKKYIGKSSELSTAKLEEIAKALNTSQQPRVTRVADTVTQVTEASNQQVTDAVTDSHTVERVTALELQMQVLRESLEALRSELLGKPEGLGNFSELPNPYEVTDSELQIELSNLKTELSNLATENEKIRADYDALLESSTVVTKKLEKEVQELRSQLETEKTRGEEIWEELSDTEQALAEVRSENSELKKTCDELRAELEQERADREEIETELSELKQKSATASKDLPEAAEILNQLKSKRKKSKADLADLEVILEILES
jgi:chromosome segregation ATPase